MLLLGDSWLQSIPAGKWCHKDARIVSWRNIPITLIDHGAGGSGRSWCNRLLTAVIVLPSLHNAPNKEGRPDIGRLCRLSRMACDYRSPARTLDRSCFG